MKKTISVVLTVVLTLAVMAVGIIAAPVRQETYNEIPVAVTAAGRDFAEPENILNSRFLNMLNHNYVYGDDIGSVEAIVNNSIIALLDLRDKENEDYISEVFVAQYVYDMYGVQNIDFSSVSPEMFKKEGYVYILPRGYSEYEHSFVECIENEDGSMTVITDVSMVSHEGSELKGVCTTLMVKNKKSAFGYNIISSDIVFDDQTV